MVKPVGSCFTDEERRLNTASFDNSGMVGDAVHSRTNRAHLPYQTLSFPESG